MNNKTDLVARISSRILRTTELQNPELAAQIARQWVRK